MNPTKEKREALFIIFMAVILHAVAWDLIRQTYGWKMNQSPEGTGVLISPIAYILWLYGFIKYAHAKGRSEWLAFFLSLLSGLGLLILLLTADLKKTKKS